MLVRKANIQYFLHNFLLVPLWQIRTSTSRTVIRDVPINNKSLLWNICYGTINDFHTTRLLIKSYLFNFKSNNLLFVVSITITAQNIIWWCLDMGTKDGPQWRSPITNLENACRYYTCTFLSLSSTVNVMHSQASVVILVDNETSDTGKTSPTVVTLWARLHKWPALQVHTLK